MKIAVSWDENAYETEVIQEESAFWQEIAKNLLNISVPNTLSVATPLGNASFTIKARGSFVRDGKRIPSMYVVENYNNISGLKDATYKEAYLTCINPESNNYKFYHLKPRSYGIDATYGRIGTERGDMFGVKDLQKPYPTYLYWVRYYEKLSKGYTDQTSIYLTPKAKQKKRKPVTNQTKTGPINQVSATLYAQLKTYARHVVQENLKDSRNITDAQIKKSKYFLRQMGERKTVNGFNKQLMCLLAICPRKARYVSELLAESKNDFCKIVTREENLISAMEALVGGDSGPQEVLTYSFDEQNIEVYLATAEQKKYVLDHLNDQLRSRVKTVYRIIPQKQQALFDAYLKKKHIENVKQLWHGSRCENWFSILINGLQLNPNAIITGKMFGNGIYFAPSAQKSFGYTDGGYWAGGDSKNSIFMGLYATAYGKPICVASSKTFNQTTVESNGGNCIHAKAGSYLRNDEIVYYNESAMVLNYLVEFAA